MDYGRILERLLEIGFLVLMAGFFRYQDKKFKRESLWGQQMTARIFLRILDRLDASEAKDKEKQ